MSTAIVHHNDLDGRAAAFIIYDFIKDRDSEISFFEMNYDMPWDWDNIMSADTIYVVDFHPQTKEELDKLISSTFISGKLVCIIDHHITTVNKLKEWHIEVPGLIDTRYCGAYLCWLYMTEQAVHSHREDLVPMFLRLVDDWDCWKHKMPETKAFNAGSQLYDTSPNSSFWLEIMQNSLYLDNVIEKGELVLKVIDQRAKEELDAYGFPVEFEGYSCMALNQGRCNSDWFKSVPNYDIYIPFYYNGKTKKFVVSLYSSCTDVSKIAKKYGGGGHKGASGFHCDKLPF